MNGDESLESYRRLVADDELLVIIPLHVLKDVHAHQLTIDTRRNCPSIREKPIRSDCHATERVLVV